jgi:hypothetical protein
MIVPEFTSFREYRGDVVVMHVIGPSDQVKKAMQMARADAKKLVAEELKNTGRAIELIEVSSGGTFGPEKTETRVIFCVREV